MSKAPRQSMATLIPAKGTAAVAERFPEGEGPEPMTGGTRRSKPIRVPLTVKVSESVYRRLREASHRLEMDKQDLVDQALDELLTRMDF